MRPMIKVAGHDIPEPSTYQATTSTVVDSARNAEAYMVGAVIRDDVAKASMSWNFISTQDWAYILSLFSIKRGGAFTNQVELFLQDIGDWDTREMYVSDRVANVFLRNKDGSIKGYTNASLSLVEV